MQLLSSSIGRKIVMAITGLLMILFVVVHLIGNTTIFGWISGGINAYAHHLHAFPPLVWAFRLVMLATVSIHIWYGIQLTIENRGGRPQQYAVKATRKATFASENMIWTGALLFCFIVYHLLHFTVKAVPGMALVPDAEGAINVFTMVVSSFQNFFVAFIYVAAMVTLFLHLSHGIQSFFQTMGWSNNRTLPIYVKAGTLVALILFLGYVAVPLSIFAGILKG
ncbi:succinate dehydrogenase cytochrome b subunit [Geobacter sp. FeAm09]|uniref:succinate dehydrogenase cytochrome b subunit n=1 Tax=Geobacter sp. FeAm09 TaxID=2597769 RepID=UPI0011EBEA30|nr:succinate dehydrogenase cytochrome b subunit [Geobacter sp. FeAm09]QEM68446.1 succinate dehydrogenase cytochrome b subunit [Geobacter sp. FeAm09]